VYLIEGFTPAFLEEVQGCRKPLIHEAYSGAAGSHLLMKLIQACVFRGVFQGPGDCGICSQIQVAGICQLAAAPPCQKSPVTLIQAIESWRCWLTCDERALMGDMNDVMHWVALSRVLRAGVGTGRAVCGELEIVWAMVCC